MVMLWISVFGLCVSGVVVLAGYCIALLVRADRPPAVELRVTPAPPPPPAVSLPAVRSDDDIATTVRPLRLGAPDATALARPQGPPTHVHVARTVVRQVIAYRPTR
jgi:hypothetical protein